MGFEDYDYDAKKGQKGIKSAQNAELYAFYQSLIP